LLLLLVLTLVAAAVACAVLRLANGTGQMKAPLLQQKLASAGQGRGVSSCKRTHSRAGLLLLTCK
jgi:hypothetical protein